MSYYKNKLTFFLVFFLSLSWYLDTLRPAIKVSREPAALGLIKSCKGAVLSFLDQHKGYNLPKYSVGTLSYKKHQAKFLGELRKLDDRGQRKSLVQLSDFRGTSRELNNAYVKLLNEAKRRKILNRVTLKKIVNHSNKSPIRLKVNKAGKVIINRNAEKKLSEAPVILGRALASKEFPEERMEVYLRWFSDISEEEVMIIKKHFTHDHSEMKALRRYLSFSRTLPDNDRLIALEHAHEVYTEGNQRKWMKKFTDDRKKLDDFKDKHRKKYLKKHKSPDEEIFKNADKHADEVAKLYEKLYYGCKNTNSTKVQLRASKTYGKYILTLAPLTAGASYSIMNWDKEKDDLWFKGIAYDIVVATFLNFYAGKLLTGAGDGHFKKLVKAMSFYGAVDLITSPAYNGIFSPSEEERKEKLKLLVTDEAQREKLNEFLTYIIESKVDPKFEEKLLELVAKGGGEAGEKLTLTDLQNLKEEDFFSPEGTEVFLSLFTEKLYDDVKGDYITTGNQGMDRFWFHRVWDVTSFPLDIYANMLIFDKLCATVNPKKAKIEAALLFLAWRGINDAGYYFSRGKVVNQ
ncbi:hypothetical protein A9Q84_03955 [Halobacteriovorax marinus]|uniref:Uncharacterized protein n=1 Tax=Halobacteriovorax marinus TaxID=97084 RepID=A0A1Y5FAE0_9BACT|nr:hypothetical protein A9Q84_03955 [Halobacteriovorax marinus]